MTRISEWYKSRNFRFRLSEPADHYRRRVERELLVMGADILYPTTLTSIEGSLEMISASVQEAEAAMPAIADSTLDKVQRMIEAANFELRAELITR